ncbi:uncharacterized protein B0I36DRAFT_315828 [Microdochium trichocladiopsis]|uniref:NmrA-like domain-containing protein n=1 Tax=Microdochium trichocladiopsis TaxID=1682393 RepID=A0A9P8YFV8_9PEZI|nr:uncharacterized protein B0I36DRAFT_315828 [Microdochium trichocladiopsis]KAH7038226.1 hypothetical protein B0I36DRAFT_315828 [Microdochium trichocladiopsis]
MRVTVFGASGVQGAAQVAALTRAGHHPVAVSRNPKPLQIDGKEVETVAADFADHDAVKRAVQDADIVFLNLPSTSFQPEEPVIAAARTVGQVVKDSPSVRLIVFNTSMPVPDESQKIEAQDHRRQMRDMIRDMGVPLISLQPVCFLDNLLEGWALPPIRDHDTVTYCHKPTLDVSWICHDDIAKLMMAAMVRPELAGRNIPIGGPETVRLPQLTERLARGWSKPRLKYEFQTVDDFCVKMDRAMRARANIDADYLIDKMHRAYTWYNDSPTEPFKVDMGPVLKELPTTLTPIEEWARTHPPPPPLKT